MLSASRRQIRARVRWCSAASARPFKRAATGSLRAEGKRLAEVRVWWLARLSCGVNQLAVTMLGYFEARVLIGCASKGRSI
jgi:hypothetical protein